MNAARAHRCLAFVREDPDAQDVHVEAVERMIKALESALPDDRDDDGLIVGMTADNVVALQWHTRGPMIFALPTGDRWHVVWVRVEGWHRQGLTFDEAVRLIVHLRGGR